MTTTAPIAPTRPANGNPGIVPPWLADPIHTMNPPLQDVDPRAFQAGGPRR